MDAYYRCPCGHEHHQHHWNPTPNNAAFSHCNVDGCRCWTYHGHRVGEEPHHVVREGLVQPTDEMKNKRLPRIVGYLSRSGGNT